MEEKLYYMFRKPPGCITAKKDAVHKTVMDYFEEPLKEKLHPVGRLDKDTQGLLLFTNDGQWNQRMMHPDFHVEKTYFFWALGELNEEKRQCLEQGVLLKGETDKTKPAKCIIKDKAHISEIEHLFAGYECSNVVRNPRNTQVVSGLLTIKEGKKRQVRRMLKAVGCYVLYLERISIGQLKLDENLPVGGYRKLSLQETEMVFKCNSLAMAELLRLNPNNSVQV